MLSPKEFEYINTSILAGTENRTLENGTILIEDVYYNFPGGTQKGFIADEVELYYPEFVETDEFGFKRIIYGFNWVFELWKQNQEQQNKIETLETELCSKDNSYSWC